jgi:large subunit ribosomal protein L34
MKLNIRNSNTKRGRMLSFRRRMRTKGGRAILSQRRRGWKPKTKARLLRRRRAYRGRH